MSSGVFNTPVTTAARPGDPLASYAGLYLLVFMFVSGYAIHLDDTAMSGGVLLVGIVGSWLRWPPSSKRPVSAGVDAALCVVGLLEMAGAL